VVLGYFYESEGIFGGAITQISTMDPRGILIIFLPPLIFESAFNSDWHIFRKQSTQIFILAFPAVIVSALTIMFFIKVVIGYD
jgi:NhaP-type Na+/H+ or K+/H+ antiporter